MELSSNKNISFARQYWTLPFEISNVGAEEHYFE
jgi:hypothetical protein